MDYQNNINNYIHISVKNIIDSIVNKIERLEYENNIETDDNSLILINGKFVGLGTYGIVVCNPRLPLKSEKIEDLVDLAEVSKIFKYKCDYIDEIEFFNINNFLKNCVLTKYLVLPLNHGIISKNELDKYNVRYYGFKKILDLSKCYIEDDEIYHIVFPKGYLIYKTTYTSVKFLLGIKNIVNFLVLINHNEIYLPDLKIINIIDTYDYKKDNLSIKNNNNSNYKIIDYTGMLSINDKDIDETINILFISDKKFFDTGFDYSSFPSFPILLLKCLLNNISIDIDINDFEKNITAAEILKIKYNNNIIYNDLHIYLFDFLKKSDMVDMEYTIQILRLNKHKLENFKFNFNMNMLNTTTMEIIDFEINNLNILNIFNQIYYEKFGYTETNHNQIYKELRSKFVDKFRKNYLNDKIDRKIRKYLIYFNIWAKYFLKINDDNSLTNIKKILFKKIQNYSFGIIIFDYISNQYKNIDYDELFVKLLMIALNSCIIQIYDEKGNLLINLNTFQDIKSIYYKTLKKISN